MQWNNYTKEKQSIIIIGYLFLRDVTLTQSHITIDTVKRAHFPTLLFYLFVIYLVLSPLIFCITLTQ